MKRILFTILFSLVVIANLQAQKIVTTFWNSQFGITSAQVYENLEKEDLKPLLADDGIFIKDNTIYAINFQTIGFKFTAGDTFYNIFGYNKYSNKAEAQDNYNSSIDLLRHQYPNIQAMGKTAGCLKLYAYADGDSGTAFSLGLYKGNNGTFFVRLNVFSDYLLKREN